MVSATFTAKTSPQSGTKSLRCRRTSNSHYSKKAEDFVAAALESRGWTIACRNFRRPRCEIDIVAVKRRTLAVVEVKFRHRYQRFDLEALLPFKKREALRRGTYAFLALARCDPDIVRFDLAMVSEERGKLKLEAYIQNVFEA